jgi:hypothetical protein
VNNTVKIGDYVQLWSDAASYGMVSKLNKKTFVVLHNLSGRTLYRYDSVSNNMYYCINNLFSCTLLKGDQVRAGESGFYKDNIHLKGVK